MEKPQVMPFSDGEKTIYMTRCGFCTHAALGCELRCAEGLPISDRCASFSRVPDIVRRVQELLDALPDRSGAQETEEMRP